MLVALSAFSAGATAPRHINDVCAVFEQNDGWFSDWESAAKRAEQERGIPVPVLMATMRKESGFKSNATPPRTKLLGFIPWTRVSTAYGYSQALDGTWSQYKQETGRSGARRSDFADAVDFVGWYHAKTAELHGIARRRCLQISIWRIISAGPRMNAATGRRMSICSATRRRPRTWQRITRRSYGAALRAPFCFNG